MLIRFVVSNFMSFKDETEFNMLSSKGNGSQLLKSHIKKSKSGAEILKTAAIYGANAAGKSNLIKAIEYLRNQVIYNNEHLVPQSYRFRMDEGYKSKPTTFRIEFTFNETHYDYGIEIKKGKIIQEWLYEIKSIKKEDQEILIFNRINNKVVFGDIKVKKKNNIEYITEFLKNELKENDLVLNILNKRVEGTELFNDVYDSFMMMKIVLPQSKSYHFMQSLSTDQKSRDFVETILANSNTGIEKIIVDEIEIDNFFSYEDSDEKNRIIDELESRIEEEGDNYIPFLIGENLHILKKVKKKYFVTVLKTKHFSSEKLFDFNEESDGTNRLFELIPAFIELLEGINDNTVYLIDELERSMHPILAKELLKFYSKNSINKNQLIFTTHESHLLDDELLRRDEIWLSEKKSDGSTDIYPLSNFNPRGDKIIERGYLQGRYGGIPFLGDFSKLLKK